MTRDKWYIMIRRYPRWHQPPETLLISANCVDMIYTVHIHSLPRAAADGHLSLSLSLSLSIGDRVEMLAWRALPIPPLHWPRCSIKKLKDRSRVVLAKRDRRSLYWIC